MKKKPVLDGYKQEGKKFTSPLKTMPGGFQEVHYADCILPEIVWLQYLVDYLGQREGINVAIEFLKICHERQVEGAPDPCFLTALIDLKEEDWTYIAEELKERGLKDSVVGSLTPFVSVYPDNNPLRPLVGDCDEPGDNDIESARTAISSLFSRYTKDSLLTQAIVTAYSLSVGKLFFAEKVRFPELDKIDIDFDSDEGQHACSFVRMYVNTSFNCREKKIESNWAQYFWNRSGSLTEFDFTHKDPEPDYSDLHPYEAFANKFADRAKAIRDKIWFSLPINYFTSESYEVIGALLSRQCSLAMKLCNPSLWDWQAGPLYLRALVDNYITVAWILKDSTERSRKFIDYGLGQEKLQIEHLRSELESMPKSDRRTKLSETIDTRVAWLNDQHWEFLQGVDVGAWAGISTREMAKDADCMDLYRFAYSPWSQAAHGTWNHVSRFNALRCEDPLKKHIFHPADFESPDFTVMMNGCKYLDMMFTAIVASYDLNLDLESLYEWTDGESCQLVQALKAYQAKGSTDT